MISLKMYSSNPTVFPFTKPFDEFISFLSISRDSNLVQSIMPRIVREHPLHAEQCARCPGEQEINVPPALD